MNFAPAQVEVFFTESTSRLGKYLQVFLCIFFGPKKNGSDSEACSLL